MSQPIISAQEGALAKGQAAVRDANDKIKARITAITNQINDIKSHWTGAAAGAFDQLMIKWNTETDKLNKILLDLEQALKTTETDQARTEEEHQASIKNLSGLLGG